LLLNEYCHVRLSFSFPEPTFFESLIFGVHLDLRGSRESSAPPRTFHSQNGNSLSHLIDLTASESQRPTWSHSWNVSRFASPYIPCPHNLPAH
jgi:hypothetical protein